MTDDPCRADLVRLVFDGTFEQVHEDIRALLLDRLFDHRPGLTADQAGLLAYERSRFVHSHLERPTKIIESPLRLFALAEWPSLLDVSTFSLLMVHYNLCFGTVLDHLAGRSDLDDYIDELDSLRSFGSYMATELGFGNNVAALRTEAVYEPGSRSIVLNTPDPLSQKFMSYSGFRSIPKLAVVMARFKVAGLDRGVFPFIVRISDENGLCPGVYSAPCPEKPVQGLDNGVTWFDHVRVPRRSLLTGDMAELTEDGEFRSSGNQRRQFLRSMTRIQPGRLCVSSSAVGAGRAAVYIALRYAQRRLTNAPGRNDMPVIEYRSNQLALFGALAKVYAMTFLLNRVKREYVDRADAVSADLNHQISVVKALSTWEMTEVIAVCRERCGAQGMFSVNRIADYGSLLQGLVTAEGDNQVLLATTAGQLLATPDPAPEPATPEPGAWSPESPAAHAALLRYREHHLRAAARAAMTDETRQETYFATWNRTINAATTMARLRGVRTALECFVEAVGAARTDQVRAGLRLLAALYGCLEVQRDCGWYLARGVLTATQVEQLPAAVDEICAQIRPYVSIMIDGFGLSPELLRAPICADDYVSAFQKVADARPVPGDATPTGVAA